MRRAGAFDDALPHRTVDTAGTMRGSILTGPPEAHKYRHDPRLKAGPMHRRFKIAAVCLMSFLVLFLQSGLALAAEASRSMAVCPAASGPADAEPEHGMTSSAVYLAVGQSRGQDERQNGGISSQKIEDSRQQAADIAQKYTGELPQSVMRYMENGAGFTETLGGLLGDGLAQLRSGLGTLLPALGGALALLLVAAVGEALLGDRPGVQTFHMPAGLLLVVTALSDFGKLLENALDATGGLSDLLLGFVPAFAGLAAAGGLTGASTAYSAAVLGFAEAAGLVLTAFARPLLAVLLAFSYAGAVPEQPLVPLLVSSTGRAIRTALSVVTTAFLMITTLQTVITASTDTAALAAGRLVLGGSIPVVGPALAESGSAILGSLRLVKAGVGAAGIAAILAAVLPFWVSYLLNSLCLLCAEAVSDCLGLSFAKRLFADLHECLRLVAAMTASYCVIAIFLTAVLLAAGGGL